MRFLFVLGAALSAQTPTQEMISQSVQVFGAIMENDKPTPVSLVGGVMADSHHVITVIGCCNRTKDGKQKSPIVKFGDEFAAAKLIWNGAGDLALIETQKDLRPPALHVIPSKLYQKGQPAFFVRFPEKGAATVAQVTAEELTQPDKVAAPVIKAKAASDSVDAGGGLFDACGNLIGLNILVDSGTQFAFVIDPVIEGLEKAGIRVSVADRVCGSGKEKESSESGWRLPQGGEWVGVGLVVALLGLALRRGTKQPARVATAVPDPPRYMPAPRTGKPGLRGVSGEYNGVMVPLEGVTVLGRDPHAANLVFGSKAESVSKRHCSIRWDAARSVFVLEDLGSTNGTFLINGERLSAGQARDLRAGERFYIGDQRNQFEVVVE